MTEKNTLILGLGNDILTDDGIGPRLVHDIARRYDYKNVQFNTASCGGLEILEYIQGFEKVVFIDAIRTLNGKPGEVYYFKPSDFRETLNLSNLHDVQFLTALRLGNSLEMNLPSDLHIIAVEIVEDMEFCVEFTLPLREKYPEILQKVNVLLEHILLKI